MKASATLPILLLFAVSCSETPRTPTELAPPSSVSGAIRGNPPPPPADAIVVVCVDGGACAAFDGSYMTNEQAASSTIGDATVSFASWTSFAQSVEPRCTSPANSWLKINRNLDLIPQTSEGGTSANAQLKCRDLVASGSGIIEVAGFEVNLENVDFFDNQSECVASCGRFVVHEGGNEVAVGQVFDREYFDDACTVFPGSEEGEGGVECDDDNGESEG